MATATIEADKAELTALKAGAVLDKIDSNQAARIGRMADLVLLSKRGRLDDESFASFRALGRQIAEDEAVRKTVGRLGENRAKSAARIRREPRTYSRYSGFSYFGDLVIAQEAGSAAGTAARERLNRHNQEIAAEVRSQSKEGRRALRSLREVTRQADIGRHREAASVLESRAMTTGDASGGTLVAPSYAVKDYATYRTFSPTFRDRLTTVRPLPDYGMTVFVPRVNAATDVAEQDEENEGLPETDPTANYVETTLETFVSKVVVSQPLFDRAGPLDFDAVVYAGLRDQLDTAVDGYVIDTALAGVTPATRASFSVPGLLSDVGKMAAGLETAAGTVLPPHGVITTPELGEWLLSQTDSQDRPVFLPWGRGSNRSDGVTGYGIAGIPLFLDGNIPSVSGDAQLIVANRAATCVYLGEPILEALPQTDAPFLSVLLRLRCYVGAVVRYPSAVASTTGAAYFASPTWA